MQLTAKLTQLLTIQTGTSKNGEWKKQDIIVETDGQYPKKVCISIWGDKINEGKLQIGNVLKIDFDIESREYNNKWYTDIKALKIEVVRKINSNVFQGGGPFLDEWNVQNDGTSLEDTWTDNN
jgi:hypothetical protein